MKKAYSIIELIIVIVVVGIMLGISVMNQNKEYEQVDQETRRFKHDLNYLKQLNLEQNFYLSNDTTWTSKSDCFVLDNSNQYSLKNNGNLLSSLNNDGLLYVINTKSKIIIKESDGTNINKICFDNIGRPYKNNLKISNILSNDLNITISTQDNEYKRELQLIKTTGFLK